MKSSCCLLALGLLLPTLVSCREPSSDDTQEVEREQLDPEGTEVLVAPPSAEPGPEEDLEGPVEAVESCEGAWVAEALPSPWWLSEAVSDDLAIKHHTPPHAYDGCTVNPLGYNPDACGVPHKGARICVAAHMGGEGRVTSTCLTATDCPNSMTCVGTLGPGEIDEAVEGFGRCEKTCDADDAKDCIRDDMWCDIEMGICRPVMPDYEGEPDEERERKANRLKKAKKPAKKMGPHSGRSKKPS